MEGVRLSLSVTRPCAPCGDDVRAAVPLTGGVSEGRTLWPSAGHCWPPDHLPEEGCEPRKAFSVLTEDGSRAVAVTLPVWGVTAGRALFFSCFTIPRDMVSPETWPPPYEVRNVCLFTHRQHPGFRALLGCRHPAPGLRCR